jgi:hypothetical protein
VLPTQRVDAQLQRRQPQHASCLLPPPANPYIWSSSQVEEDDPREEREADPKGWYTVLTNHRAGQPGEIGSPRPWP